LNVKFAEPCRACVVWNIQRVYTRAWLVRLGEKQKFQGGRTSL
jgi:hypothetical protein